MLSDVVLRLRALFKRTAVDREIDDELRFHLEKQIESYQSAGLSREEATRRAHLEFGGLDQIKEDYRDALGVRLIDSFARDVRLAMRSLRATPIVSAVAILSLALGIGANTAIFSIVNSLLLRSLPVADPDRLAIVRGGEGAWSNPIWEEVRTRSDLFDGWLAWSTRNFNTAPGGEAQMVTGVWASGSYFDVLGIRPHIGRVITPADDRRGGGPDGAVAVLGYDFWQRQYGGVSDVVGRQITLDRVPFTIVGVAPAGFSGLDVGRAFDVIMPIGAEPLMRGKDSLLDARLTWWLQIMVRLKPGQTVEAAQAVMPGLHTQVRAATMPPNRTSGEYLDSPLTLEPAATGRSTLRSRYQRPLFTILIVVALVLLIACANIANLLFARAAARQHELSVRQALGATRWRLVQQLLIESLALACLGAALGLLFARWAGPLIVAQLSTQVTPVFLDLALDWRVLAFTTAVTMLTAVIFGTVPALRASRVAPAASMQEGGRTLTDDRRQRVASGLVVAQVALSLVLVAAAGLFLRTFVSLAAVPLGFEAERILVAGIDAPQAIFADTDRLPLFERAQDDVSRIPGVARAGLSLIQPVSGGVGWGSSRLAIEGVAPPSQRQTTWMNAVTPGWLAVLGIPLRAGRDVNDDDREGAPLVAIVNEAFARRFSIGPNPVGRVILAKREVHTSQGEEKEIDVRVEIVGLAADAVYMRPRDPIPPTMYVPLEQYEGTYPALELSIRAASGSPILLAKSVAAAIANVNPDLVLTFRPVEDLVSATLIQERLLAMLSGFFGVTALLLAGLGLYGVTSYSVTRRRSEIGIRMALGAKASGVIRLVLARVFGLVLLGVVLGGIASVWASRYVATLLYGLEPHDLATLVGSAVLLAAVAAVAGWLPARRAARIDPATVLRES